MRLHQRIRRTRLQGEQLDITFPWRRGRPTRYRQLERAGQMRLGLDGQITLTDRQNVQLAKLRNSAISLEQDVKAAADYLFPVGPMTDAELAAEFDRLFPIEA